VRFGPFLNIPSPETVRVCTPRLASGAKNIENGARKRKNQSISAENTEFGAGKWKNQPFRAKTSYYSAEIPAEKYRLSAICPMECGFSAKNKQRNRKKGPECGISVKNQQRNRIRVTHQRVTY